MRIVAIIPARGGSKGIPKKNLVQVMGKPLIDWTIEATINSKLISDVVVSSDDEAILNNASNFQNVICIKRPVELAEDNSPTEPVLTHALETLKSNKKEYDVLVLLQPTSPLRDSLDIDNSIDAFLNGNATSLISVVEPDHHPLKSFQVNKEGYLTGIINNDFPFMPRQSLPKVYQPNGAIYITNIEHFLETGKLFSDETIPFLMSKKNSIDIDTKEDLEKINKLKK